MHWLQLCFTRLTNAFSKKIDNHMAEVALVHFTYNFIEIRQTLRVTPATAAGVTDQLRGVEDLVAAWEASEQRLERPLRASSINRAIGVRPSDCVNGPM
jgi:hypothetical protein